MAEVKVKGEDLSGLGWTLKSLMDANISKADLWQKVRKIHGTLVVRETGADVAATISFEGDDIFIQDGAIDRPSAYLAAGFDELSEVASGQIGPIRALVTGKIKARGNLLKLLRMAKAIISTDTD
jgi:SCP-2 sterol transfer family